MLPPRTNLRSGTHPLATASGVCHTDLVVEKRNLPPPFTILFLNMNLTKSFPPADALIETLQEVDYAKLYQDVRSFVLTVAAIVAVVATILWDKIQTMKFQTPEMFTKYFYLGVNMIGEPSDEIVGMSVGNRYIGLYSNGIAWGVLNEQGALTNQ